jgi:hypothetical protein
MQRILFAHGKKRGTWRTPAQQMCQWRSVSRCDVALHLTGALHESVERMPFEGNPLPRCPERISIA